MLAGNKSPIVINVDNFGALDSVRNLWRLLVALATEQYIRYSFVYKCLRNSWFRFWTQF